MLIRDAIQAEQPIKLDPNRFAAWADHLASQREWHGQITLLSQTRFRHLFRRETDAYATPVALMFTKRGVIEARSGPAGAILAVAAKPADWAVIEKSWNALLVELERDGLLAIAGIDLPPIPAHPFQERRANVRRLKLAGKARKDIARAIRESEDIVKHDLSWLNEKGLMPKH